ncbi:hypothetical protein LTR37_013959 [Vermiconidia calcicola]|uniref:Uncharacterized protein n=1 Tax=Vermiconidia calcicola TaxID=1690605 RepID=A0ACC3MUZ9_9PEZI|nr:hypothetical protein LTR37_013959 [Vermiconidia calcicola]
MVDYVYTPLEGPTHIRLIKVHQSDNADIQILHSSLNEAPLYECVSYAWKGDDRSLRAPTQSQGYLRVTSSLMEALPYLTTRCQTGYLWIDQICINQDDGVPGQQ